MIATNDFKRGMVIQLDGAPCLILEYTTQSPSARGGHTLVKTKYRNLLTGQLYDEATMCRVALAYEQATEWKDKHPTLT